MYFANLSMLSETLVCLVHMNLGTENCLSTRDAFFEISMFVLALLFFDGFRQAISLFTLFFLSHISTSIVTTSAH